MVCITKYLGVRASPELVSPVRPTRHIDVDKADLGVSGDAPATPSDSDSGDSTGTESDAS